LRNIWFDPQKLCGIYGFGTSLSVVSTEVTAQCNAHAHLLVEQHAPVHSCLHLSVSVKFRDITQHYRH